MKFVNTTAIAYGQKIGRSLIILVHAIAVVFTNVMRLRVEVEISDYIAHTGTGVVALSLRRSAANEPKCQHEHPRSTSMIKI